jgi:cytosine permease
VEKVDVAKNPEAPPEVAAKNAPLSTWQIVGILCIYVVGFFATAGAAGTDISMGSRDARDVHIGGLMGILVPTVLAGGAGMLVVAGAYGGKMVQPQNLGVLNPVTLMPDLIGKTGANLAMIALAISAFPGACFSSFIAANSFKTTMPKVNPFISVGAGALVAAFLAVTGVVGTVIWVFQVIGASFGPVCGAMVADYLLSGRKWSGPRAGFNPAGWISWIVGFAVGAFNLVVDLSMNTAWAKAAIPHLADYANLVPVPPVAAFVVGFVLYLVLALLGAQTRTLEMPSAAD